MILICSEFNDMSTNNVIDWIIASGKDYFRYNNADEIKHVISKIALSLNLSNNGANLKMTLENDEYDLEKHLNAVWFRRPYQGIDDFFEPLEKQMAEEIPNEIFNQYLKYHYKDLKNYIVNLIESCALGSYHKTGLNKPITLHKARKIGLLIPNTLITNSKKELKKFLALNNNKVITKALHQGVKHVPEHEKYWFSNKTVLLEHLKNIPENFNSSLFQQYIEKSFDIRVFYLNGIFYSACIMSQRNEKTKIDFRNYDWERPNRIIPYKLSHEIQDKLHALMKILELNTGSIDLIRDKDGKEYFLEINPVGQYGFISRPCNYYLDKAIADYLIYHE